MTYDLDPFFETLFLLAGAHNVEQIQKEAFEQLSSMGLTSKTEFDSNFRVVKRYYTTFQKYRRKTPDTLHFDDLDQNVLFIFCEVFQRQSDWKKKNAPIDEEQAKRTVEAVVAACRNNDDQSLVEALQAQDLTDRAKWQILALIQQPQALITNVAGAVLSNIEAFEHALAKVKPELEVLLERFNRNVQKHNVASPMSIPHDFDPSLPLIPTLALPLLIGLSERVCFYGLLVDSLIPGTQAEFTKNEVLLGAKTLGDSTKLDILLALKKGRLYNQEIAKRTDLTPATISYHMNALLAAGFVTIEKADGKTYYHLAPTGITRFVHGVENMLRR